MIFAICIAIETCQPYILFKRAHKFSYLLHCRAKKAQSSLCLHCLHTQKYGFNEDLDRNDLLVGYISMGVYWMLLSICDKYQNLMCYHATHGEKQLWDLKPFTYLLSLLKPQ